LGINGNLRNKRSNNNESTKKLKAMTDDSVMPFGKYKGEKMSNIPASYLLWLFENSTTKNEVYFYIKDNLDVIKAEIKQSNK
jgi:uncharacterized protein (DUF3820 family)